MLDPIKVQQSLLPQCSLSRLVYSFAYPPRQPGYIAFFRSSANCHSLPLPACRRYVEAALGLLSALLLAAALIALFLIIFVLAGVLIGRHPGLAVHVVVLVSQVVAFSTNAVLSSLGQSAGTGGQLRLDSCAGLNPVGECILAILDDCLGSLISVVSVACLAGCDWGVVNKLEQVLAVAGNNCELLAVLADGVELVSEGCLDLLAGDVGELGFCYERLGLSADKLLLEDNNLRAVWLLVFELRDLVGDLLLAWSRSVCA